MTEHFKAFANMWTNSTVSHYSDFKETLNVSFSSEIIDKKKVYFIDEKKQIYIVEDEVDWGTFYLIERNNNLLFTSKQKDRNYDELLRNSEKYKKLNNDN